MEIDKAELEAFIASRRKLGWTDYQLRRHKDGETWWGEKANMPMFCDHWTQGLWMGWVARSRVGARRPMTAEDYSALVKAMPGGADGFIDQWALINLVQAVEKFHGIDATRK